MRSGTVIQVINASIAIFVLLIVAVVYRYAYRPLPQTSGSVDAPVSASARIIHDERGVPHIQAATWQDAIFLQGYVTAQERLWQMDALRRLAAGELSEIIGPSTIQLDRQARSLRLKRIAVENYKHLPPADQAVLDVYARGVNFYIERHLGRLPLEFTVLSYSPKPWTGVDSILCSLQMFVTLTTTWRDELLKQTMLSSGDPAKVNQLFPVRMGREIQPGSNAWTVSGEHSTTGKPILANDPHLDYTIPSTWYQVHLRAPGLDAIGVSLPGIPAVIIGHNRNIAWGVTNLGFDVQDLYAEKIDPKTGRYEYEGHPVQAVLERESIAVRGTRPVPFQQWVTRHGPLFLNDGGRFVAMRWTAAESDIFQFPFLDIDRASNWTEFTAAIARFPGPGQNFVYADTAGHIGYHATGKLPIRRSFDGDVILDGSSGKYEWEGYIPFDQLPSFYDPSGGMIVTANQNPFPVPYAFRVGGEFSPPYRSNQIRDLLSSRSRWKPADMLSVEKDVYSPFCQFLARQLVAAYDERHPSAPDLGQAIAILRRWNGQMEIGQAAPIITTLVYERLRYLLAEAAAPKRGRLYEYEMAPAVVENVLASGARGWFADKDKALLDSLSLALAEARRIQGADMNRWDYGQFHSLQIVHPVFGQVPLLGRYFNIGPIPMSGSSTTVKQVSGKLGPSMRFIADLSDWDHSLNNLTIGESGHILSPHYKDQWSAYYLAHSYPMEFDHITSDKVLEVHPPAGTSSSH